MVKTEFIKVMADKAGITQEEAKVAFDAFVETLKDVLPEERKVTLAGFGNFELKKSEKKVAMNPKTGEKIEVEEHDIPNFKFCKAFKEMF